MKNKILFVVLLSVFQIVILNNNLLSAQKLKPAEVPSDVVQTLEEQYSYVKVTGWMKEGNTYIASIKDGSTNGKVYLSSAGEWIRTLFTVPTNELPSSITDYVKENYPDFVIAVSALEEKEDESTHYYLEVKEDAIGAKPSVLTFASTGTNKLLSRTDPEGFQDPTMKHPDKIEQAKAAAAEKQAQKAEAAKREAEEKAAAEKAAKEAAKAAAKTPAPKPTTTTASKPATSTSKPTTTASKPAEPQKEAKPKKEKPEPVVKDEHGNIAIKANTVPEVVSKALVKKVLHPAELNWFLVDSMYIARCLNQGKKTAVYITPQGIWEKTLTIMPEESVSGLMAKHLNDFYPGWRFKSAVKEQRADKDDKMMVEFYEKANYKAKLVTTVFFDKAGKLIRTVDPDYELGGGKSESAEDDALNKYYEKMNMTLDNDDASSVPENVKAAFKLKYPKVTNVEWKEDGYMNYIAAFYTTRGKEFCVFNSYGEITETWVLGKNESLSATIQDYLKKEYKSCKLKEFYTVKRLADKLTAYKVIIVDKKTQEEQELWFNLSGKPIEY
ncbi:MAG: PepSY-like domain-containing protein [Bacteroidales bacterium]|nr:PepSY-like domain-containing protein [Bacteroidales bacterium]